MDGSVPDTAGVPDGERPIRFDTASYQRLLQRLLDAGRTFVGFDDREDGVVIHHDVELSPRRALAMARLETTFRIGSTYCVPLDSPMYDASTVAFERFVRTLSQLGHDVGLQFDPAAHWMDPPTEDELRERIDAERAVLRRLIGHPVDVVSFRNPTERLRTLELPGGINACCPPADDPSYRCVDDREWRNGDPFTNGIPARFRLLVHPGLWHPEERTEADAVDDRRRAARREVASYFDAFDVE